MKNLLALVAVAGMLAGCAMPPPDNNKQSHGLGSNQLERNTDQDLRNDQIRDQDSSPEFDNDWDREHYRDRGNEGHEDQAGLRPWPGSGYSGEDAYPGGHRWGY